MKIFDQFINNNGFEKAYGTFLAKVVDEGLDKESYLRKNCKVDNIPEKAKPVYDANGMIHVIDDEVTEVKSYIRQNRVCVPIFTLDIFVSKDDWPREIDSDIQKVIEYFLKQENELWKKISIDAELDKNYFIMPIQERMSVLTEYSDKIMFYEEIGVCRIPKTGSEKMQEL